MFTIMPRQAIRDGTDWDPQREGAIFGFSSTSPQGYTSWEFMEPNLVEPREDVTDKQAKAVIDDFWNSGKPFFTKEAIRDLYEQMQAQTSAGGYIVTKDITGASLEWKVRVGEKVLGWTKADPLGGLGVDWNDYTRMKSNLDWQSQKSVIRSAFAPMGLLHKAVGILCDCDCKDDDEPTDNENDSDRRETVVREFREASELWEQSEEGQNFKSLLRSSASEHGINKIVGLSCGSLCLPNNENVTMQTAILLAVKNWLKEGNENQDIPCFIQDPMNTPLDKEVLSDIGFDMVDDPRGWLEIDERSVLLSVSSNVPVKSIVADTARPAIVIWDRVSDHDQRSSDPITSRVRQMMEEYDAYEFDPEDDGPVIYIRKSKVPPVANEDGTFCVFRSETGPETE